MKFLEDFFIFRKNWKEKEKKGNFWKKNLEDFIKRKGIYGKKWKILVSARVRRKSPYRYTGREIGPEAFADGPSS